MLEPLGRRLEQLDLVDAARVLEACLVGSAGGFGLFYLTQVTHTAELFSDVTVPLVGETTSLFDRLQDLHLALLGVFDLNDIESHQAFVQQLTAFDTTFADNLTRLRQRIAGRVAPADRGLGSDHPGASN